MVLSTLLLAAEAVAEKAEQPDPARRRTSCSGARCCFVGAVGPDEVRPAPADRVKTMQERAAKVRDDLDAGRAGRAPRPTQRHRAVRGEPGERQGRGRPASSRTPGPRPTPTAGDEAGRGRGRGRRAAAGRGRRGRRRPRPTPWPSSAAASPTSRSRPLEAVVQKPLDPTPQMQVIEDYVNRAGSPN